MSLCLNDLLPSDYETWVWFGRNQITAGTRSVNAVLLFALKQALHIVSLSPVMAKKKEEKILFWCLFSL
jgi:hypothetical protein